MRGTRTTQTEIAREMRTRRTTDVSESRITLTHTISPTKKGYGTFSHWMAVSVQFLMEV